MSAPIFSSVKEILAALETISDLVHKVPEETPIRKQIDEQVSFIAQRCIDISDALANGETD